MYSHIFNEDRRTLAQKMEKDFFQHSGKEDAQKHGQNDDAHVALQLLQANPDIARLIIATLGKDNTA